MKVKIRGGEGEEEDLVDPVGKDLARQDPKEEEEADLQKRKLLKKKILRELKRDGEEMED